MYENRQKNQVYDGARYAAPEAPQAVGDVRMAQDVTADMRAKGQEAASRNLGMMGKVFVDRYEFMAKAQEQQRLAEADAQGSLEFDRRMALPNGDPDGFFDESGRPRQKRLREFIDAQRRAVEDIKSGSVVPENQEKSAMWKQEYVRKIDEKYTAGVMKAVSDRSRKAFDDMYKLYMAREDYASAADLANQAYDNHLMSKAEAELYTIRARKGVTKGRVQKALGDGIVDTRKMTNEMLMSLMDEDGGEKSGGELPQEVLMSKDLQTHVEGASELESGESNVKFGGLESAKERVTEDGIRPDSVIDSRESDEMSLRLGLREFSNDEFAEMWRDVALANGGMEVTRRDDGTSTIDINLNAPEAAQAYTNAANESGGFTREKYRQMAYAIAAGMPDDENYKGLTDEQLSSAIVKATDITGIENEIFSDADNPALAKQAFLQGIARNVVMLRKESLRKRVNNQIKSLEEGNPLAATEDIAMAEAFEASGEQQRIAWATEKWFNSAHNVSEFEKIRDAYRRHQAAFFKDNPKRANKSEYDNIDEFRDWYREKGKAYQQDLKEYRKGALDYVAMRCADAISDYRLNGGEDWKDEEEIIAEESKRALADYKNEGEYKKYKAKREKEVQARANKIAIDYEAARVEMKEKQKEYADREKARKESEKQRAKEEEKRQNPYRHDVRMGIGYEPDDDNELTMTVPEAEYEAMREQLGCEDGEGVSCTLNGGTKKIIVKPGNVKRAGMNLAAMMYAVGGKKMTKKQLAERVNKGKYNVKFHKANEL